MNASTIATQRQLIQADLLARPVAARALADPNRPILASLIAGRCCGAGVLPAHLGLSPEALADLWADYFPGDKTLLPAQNLVETPECQDIAELLLEYRAGHYPSEIWLANIVASACAGSDHLWQDLGLANRDELSHLLNHAFPHLARQNTGDMKWKKFIYRFYCARDGIYVCPAPSCGECSDYANCFAPET
ncbi:MAG: nitrogen fixation protein NifQ [Zoogloeaceae bacterium]|jgi:nitrogen fixation protein NifQ|nr:nitrogen fixation protein NifQ [Zoogloeaceae bacterium]